MEITSEQFSRIETFLPVQRGNVSLTNLQVVNAILYVAENGCKWRSLPKPRAQRIATPTIKTYLWSCWLRSFRS